MTAFLCLGTFAVQGQLYDRARELFLLSSTPAEALELQCDLQQWAQAIKLAEVTRVRWINLNSYHHRFSFI